jgi:hypothetical protein
LFTATSWRLGKFPTIKEVLRAQVKHPPLEDKGFFFTVDEKPFVCKAFAMHPLVDGFYSVVVVDASEDTTRDGVILELAITQGSAKGEVVKLRASSMKRSAIDLLGLPATLEVREGSPRVIFDAV